MCSRDLSRVSGFYAVRPCFDPSKERKRYLHPLEAMASQGLPATQTLSKVAGCNQLQLDGISDRQLYKMAGNGMSLRCMGAIQLGAMFCLQRKDR